MPLFQDTLKNKLVDANEISFYIIACLKWKYFYLTFPNLYHFCPLQATQLWILNYTTPIS